jgi:hypothetical protein
MAETSSLDGVELELVINKKTATALRMTIAPSLLSRADRLVE